MAGDSMPVAVCATVMAPTTRALVAARDRAAAQADLVEIRLDAASAPDVRAVLEARPCPVVVTCRPTWEGGAFHGSESDRHDLLRQALDAGAEYVDVEWQATFRSRLLSHDPRRIVVSMHDFEGVPADLHGRYRDMRASGAAIVKLAVAVRRLDEQQALLALAREVGEAGRHVLVAMGEAGLATRVLAARLGNAWTYAGEVTAVGQLPVEALVEDYGVRRLAGAETIYGVLGRPIQHSLSPAMHNAAFRAMGLGAVHLPLAAADAQDFLVFADAVHVAGCSVTAPFKGDALALATAADEVSREVGAANTLRRRPDGTWEARNTDVAGFLAPLAGVDLARMRVAVLGAGGAARAVAVALRARAARVTIHARRVDVARRVAAELGVLAGPPVPEVGAWDLLVNATPVGTWPQGDVSPVADELVRGELVYDLVYNPRRTRLLRVAARHGARTIGGLDMLIAQAEEQFAWWTGQRPPAGVMRAAAERVLARQSQVQPGEE